MNHKLIACLTFMLGGAASAFALNETRPWIALGTSTPERGHYVRIEIPPVQIVDASQITDLDVAVILRQSPEATDLPAPVVADQEPELATGPKVEASSPQFEASAPTPQVGQPSGLIDVNFNLAESGASDRSSLDVRKGVRLNGADAGQATIRVGSGAALFIASEDLRTLLSAAKRVDLVESLVVGANQPFVAFDAIRQKGVNLRYDATSDQILISG